MYLQMGTKTRPQKSTPDIQVLVFGRGHGRSFYNIPYLKTGPAEKGTLAVPVLMVPRVVQGGVLMGGFMKCHM